MPDWVRPRVHLDQASVCHNDSVDATGKVCIKGLSRLICPLPSSHKASFLHLEHSYSACGTCTAGGT